MNCEVVKRETVNRIPEFGEAWCQSQPVVYLRINDEQGSAIFPNVKNEALFFSVNLSTGNIVYTSKTQANIHILAPESGVLRLVPKEAGNG